MLYKKLKNNISNGEKMNRILDNKIKLDKKTHSYSLIDNLDIAFTSVTTFIDCFFDKFDAEKVAKKLVANYPKYKDRTVESLVAEWDESARYGNIVHDEIEEWVKNKIEPKELKSLNGKKWLKAYQSKSNIEIMSEVIIYSEELKIAGTVDILAKDNNTGEYVIIDWKTSKKINKVSFKHKTGIHEVSKNIMDCNFSHYSLQLSLYRYILEEYYNLKVRNQVIAHLKDEGVDAHLAPYLKRDITNMLKCSLD